MISVLAGGTSVSADAARSADLAAVLDRLGAPVRTVLPATDLPAALHSAAAVLREAGSPVVLVRADLVLPDEAMAELVQDPRGRTAVAVSARVAHDIRRRETRVLSAGSSAHTVGSPDATSVGVLVVAVADLVVAADAAVAMAGAAQRAGWSGDPVDFLLVALARSGVAVAAVDLDPWPWGRPASATELAALRAELAATDAGGVRLARSARADDGFYSTFVIRRLSHRLTPMALRLGLTPNQITLASLAVGLLAAVSFAGGSRPWLVAGALLLQLSLVVDCVDGEVARYTRRFSSLGAWLDASTDRVKEYACYAGLAIGWGGGSRIWTLAAAMLALQVVRHTTAYTFTLVKTLREGSPARVPLDVPDDAAGRPAPATGSLSARALQSSERINRRPVVYWAKKALHMPIGERWLVISVLAAVASAQAVFVALLALGLVALCYTSAGHLVRSRSWAVRGASDREREVVGAQLDLGPVARRALARPVAALLRSRFAWSLPPLLRTVEQGAVIAVTLLVAPDAMPATFALLFAVAYHHYDALYRVLNGLPPSGTIAAAGLGVEGRLLLLLLLALAGEPVFTAGLVVLAVGLGGLFAFVGTAGALRAVRGGRTPRPGGDPARV